MTLLLDLFVPCEIVSMNAERARSQWYTAAQMTAETRKMASVMARRAMPSRGRLGVTTHAAQGVTIEVTPVARFLNRDTFSGCAPTAKACIDGLVDAGILPNDGPKTVVAVTFLAPVRGDDEGLTLRIFAGAT